MLLLFTAGYIDAKNQSHEIEAYLAAVADLDSGESEHLIKQAKDYNRSLAQEAREFSLNEEQVKKYPDMLKLPGSDVMGIIEIARTNCLLPIHYGTDDEILSIDAGHVEWSSLPVGGSSTHSVIFGHRGLFGAKEFTDLEQMEIGDTFKIHIIDQVLLYKVDRIQTAEPDDIRALSIEEDKDYCTLEMCTPYGINPRRIMVRGERVENSKEEKADGIISATVQRERFEIIPLIAVPIMAIPILTMLLIMILVQCEMIGKRCSLKDTENNGRKSFTAEEHAEEK